MLQVAVIGLGRFGRGVAYSLVELGAEVLAIDANPERVQEIADQVALHQWLLQTIDQVLIPSARNRDLERLLTDTRPTVAAHLEQARQIQNSLGR